jgi:hypothetical protein
MVDRALNRRLGSASKRVSSVSELPDSSAPLFQRSRRGSTTKADWPIYKVSVYQKRYLKKSKPKGRGVAWEVPPSVCLLCPNYRTLLRRFSSTANMSASTSIISCLMPDQPFLARRSHRSRRGSTTKADWPIYKVSVYRWGHGMEGSIRNLHVACILDIWLSC